VQPRGRLQDPGHTTAKEHAHCRCSHWKELRRGSCKLQQSNITIYQKIKTKQYKRYFFWIQKSSDCYTYRSDSKRENSAAKGSHSSVFQMEELTQLAMLSGHLPVQRSVRLFCLCLNCSLQTEFRLLFTFQLSEPSTLPTKAAGHQALPGPAARPRCPALPGCPAPPPQSPVPIPQSPVPACWCHLLTAFWFPAGITAFILYSGD